MYAHEMRHGVDVRVTSRSFGVPLGIYCLQYDVSRDSYFILTPEGLRYYLTWKHIIASDIIIGVELVKAKSPHIDAPAILSAAINHMNERAANYDTPSGERSMSLTVTVTELLMPGPLTEAKGWLMMDVLKTVRALTALQHGKLHQDSIEDKVAYAALFGEAVARQVETQTKE